MTMRWYVVVAAVAAVWIGACGDDDGDDGTKAPSGGSGCPGSAPTDGSQCMVVDAVCSYGQSLQPECRDTFSCDSGTWFQWDSVCMNAPPAACTGPTAPGTVCEQSLVSSSCEYPATSQVCWCTAMICNGACQQLDPPEWVCFDPPAADGCPAAAPNSGTACSQEGLQCDYLGGDCGQQGVTARCEQGAWTWAGEMPCPA